MSEKSSGVTAGQGREGDMVPTEIKVMADKKSIDLYLKLLESGSEKKRDICLVVVGKKGAGKTSLIRRLFGEDITDVNSTNGIEIHKIKCKAMSDDGIWKKLDGKNEEEEIHARLLKPFEERLSQDKDRIDTPVAAEANKPIKENKPRKNVNETEKLETEKPNLLVKSFGNEPQVATLHPNKVFKKAGRDIKTMTESEVDFKDKEEYATLLLWDFAGDEEFYQTHQTFLSPDAIYLVVTNLNEADEKEAKDMFQLWMNSIHCHCRLDNKRKYHASNTTESDESRKENKKYLDPPVVFVGSHKDQITASEGEEILNLCKKCFDTYVNDIPKVAQKHIQDEHFISNTDMTANEEIVFQNLRQSVLKLARKMTTWNTKYPLKFIQLEKLLQEKKKELPIISFKDLSKISTETPKPLNEEELMLFLKFHHEIRALVYFEDLPAYIILDTQWLSNAFKCIITAEKFQSNVSRHRFPCEWDDFNTKGILNSVVLEQIFETNPTVFKFDERLNAYEHTDHILRVMEKFDIIICPNITDKDAADVKPPYYVPCMIKTEPESDIYKMFHVSETCKKSTWLCIKFMFLPPHLKNHLIASLYRKYGIAEVPVCGPNKRPIALFKGTAVFKLQEATNLLVMFFADLIQIQVWEFRQYGNSDKSYYKNIAEFVTAEIKRIINRRFKMTTVKFEQKLECYLQKPDCVKGSCEWNDMKTDYFCDICTKRHDNEWSEHQPVKEQHQDDPSLSIPSIISSMGDKKYVPLYLKLLESGFEKKRDIRLVVVGKQGAGKTLLIKRLFKEVKKETGIFNSLQGITRRKKENITSTNGIEIHRIRCKATVDDDKWEKLDAKCGEAELNARLLKPYEVKVFSEIGTTSEAPGEASVHKITKDETAVTISEEAVASKTITNKTASSPFGKSMESDIESQQPEKVKSESFPFEVKLSMNAEFETKPLVTTHLQVENDFQFQPPGATHSLQHLPNRSQQQAYDDIEDMLKSPVDLQDKEEYATLMFWDFAGDKEFYHTHQTFLSPDSIYLVVTKLNEAGEQNAGEMFQLWMNSIHCYCSLEDQQNTSESKAVRIDNSTETDRKYPPVILVGSHKDKVKKLSKTRTEKECKRHIDRFVNDIPSAARKHITKEFFVSNTNDDDSEFHKIRQYILDLARTMKTWNKEYPLKFIQLEKRLQEKNKDLQIPCMSFQDITDISNEISKPLNEQELMFFLEFHHEIRTLVYFKDLPEFIILDTQWLCDVFKCIVTAEKFQTDERRHQLKDELDDLNDRGLLHSEVLDAIFQDKKNILYKLDEHKTHILKVMEKFDIIIPATKNNNDDQFCFYVPCMVKSQLKSDIYQICDVSGSLWKKSTWLCFEFIFLPPHLMNHLIASLSRKYDITEVKHPHKKEKRKKALFRETVVFELNATKLRKLLVKTHPKSIQVQVLDYKTESKGNVFLDIETFLTNELQKIIHTRFRMSNVKFKKKWKCGLRITESAKEMNDFNEDQTAKYYCTNCKTTHEFTNEWAPIKNVEAASVSIPDIDRTSKDVYVKKEGQTGLVLIVNFMFGDSFKKIRTGSETDEESLKHFFSKLGYHVQCPSKDMTTDEFINYLHSFERDYLTKKSEIYHSFFCVIMSHGNESGILTVDGEITVKVIQSKFKNKYGGKFNGKPKIFLIQACRGIKKQTQLTVYDSFETESQIVEKDEFSTAHSSSENMEKTTEDGDIILAFATTKGYKASRNTYYGSMFIRSFLSVAEEHYKVKHVEEILLNVRQKLSGNMDNELKYGDSTETCQVAISVSTCTKKVYL